MTSKKHQARKIRDNIRQLLLKEWDPIGIGDMPAAQDEYDSYIGGVYRLLASGATKHQVAEHLAKIARDWMGFETARAEELLPVADQLLRLSVELDNESDG